MAIPLQPVNLPQPYDAMGHVFQTIQDYNKMRTGSVRRKLMEAQTQAVPINAEAALYKAEHGPQYGAVINQLTGLGQIYNKYTGTWKDGHAPINNFNDASHLLNQMEGNEDQGGRTPAIASHPATQAQSIPQQQEQTPGAMQQGQGTFPYSQPQTQQAPLQQNQLPNALVPQGIRNLTTGGTFTRGGTQTSFPNREGGTTVTTSPTKATSTTLAGGGMGQAGFEAVLPYLNNVAKNFGGVELGQGGVNLAHVMSSPNNERKAASLGQYLALERITATMSADLARMATGGSPAVRTMAHYRESVMGKIPSSHWLQPWLMYNKFHDPKFDAQINQYQQKYYAQMEEEIQEARQRYGTGGSPINMGPTRINEMGQPIPQGGYS